jgi:hypothetical protein
LDVEAVVARVADLLCGQAAVASIADSQWEQREWRNVA